MFLPPCSLFKLIYRCQRINRKRQLETLPVGTLMIGFIHNHVEWKTIDWKTKKNIDCHEDWVWCKPFNDYLKTGKLLSSGNYPMISLWEMTASKLSLLNPSLNKLTNFTLNESIVEEKDGKTIIKTTSKKSILSEKYELCEDWYPPKRIRRIAKDVVLRPREVQQG